MFSYRHAFHAGNHADVLKHAILVAILKHLAQKDKAFWVFDTHAGAGLYRLDAAQARKNAEHQEGVAALWSQKHLPSLLEDYRLAVAQFGIEQALRDGREQRRREAVRETPEGGEVRHEDRVTAQAAPAEEPPSAAQVLQQRLAGGRLFDRPPLLYPGSPALALQFMRPQDRMRCFEAHPTEIRVLQRNLSWAGRRLQIFGEDGFEGLKALLPPVSRRGMVLIDPSYEDKRDYARARRTLLEALERFATGTMVLWYPLVRRREVALLMEQLHRLPAADWLDVRLQVCRPPVDGHGLYGSGMLVINPPYTLADDLREAMPALQRLLGQDDSAGWVLATSADAPRGTPVKAESSTGRRVDRSPLAREHSTTTAGTAVRKAARRAGAAARAFELSQDEAVPANRRRPAGKRVFRASPGATAQGRKKPAG